MYISGSSSCAWVSQMEFMSNRSLCKPAHRLHSFKWVWSSANSSAEISPTVAKAQNSSYFVCSSIRSSNFSCGSLPFRLLQLRSSFRQEFAELHHPPIVVVFGIGRCLGCPRRHFLKCEPLKSDQLHGPPL